MGKTSQQSFWQSRPCKAVTGVLAFIAAYAFGSWAIDTGRYWYYIATLIFTLYGMSRLARAIKNR